MGQFGGRNFKKGGAKVDSPMNAKDKGIPSGGSYPGKQSWAKKGGNAIVSPMTEGNKGITSQKGFPSSPAKFDD